MRSYVARRLLSLLPVLLGLSVIAFGLMALVPGDPAEIIAAPGKETEPTDEEILAVRRQLGLDRPWPLQYLAWLQRVLTGDLGRSLRSGEPVAQELVDRLPATLELAAGGLAVGLLIALPVGILAAVRRGSLADHASRALALLGASVPSFWLGALLILLFAVELGWLPAMGRGSRAHLLLPSLSLGVGASAILTRLVRASLLEVLGQDYIRTAHAKGLPGRAVILGHALKPSLLPVVTVLGLQFGHLVGGAVIIETVFAWPGLGQFIIRSILARDFPVIQGFALLMGLVFVCTNFAVDVVYRLLDPRIQYRGKAS
ncbi:MAG: ABC transporter permease [Chloroflexi bacterium]|nr:ABC transporter permease [Chloroflexota bacterium]